MLVGWLSWRAILAAIWAIAFVIAEVIPLFSDLLFIMSSLFDSFFGFIFEVSLIYACGERIMVLTSIAIVAGGGG